MIFFINILHLDLIMSLLGYHNYFNIKDFSLLIKFKNNKNYTKNEYIRILIILNKISPKSSYVYNYVYFRKLLYFFLRPNIFLLRRGYNILWKGNISTIVRVNLYNRNMIRTTKSYDLYVHLNPQDEENTNKPIKRLLRKVNPLDCSFFW